jgi:hypothetical protein
VLLTTCKPANGYNEWAIRSGNPNSPLAVVKDANAAVITPPSITPHHRIMPYVLSALQIGLKCHPHALDDFVLPHPPEDVVPTATEKRAG